ncbi:DDE-type integrase/transposase/recombinase [Patescibacteria group bacterium]|nr:DDE-type integrase/transposase/recombinase [Patescibacteria group bacterium]MBU4367665.1 DDE-type integrase/transposase/recombinase [Patescibacteria group bacterium]MBU4461885.1 DDE-type integrase/transposase/recombinase [Patescibacteria group bacterium]MCG2699984.1 integrase core domain-containing protein [Candidatus Parcubacteria bacterium]
MAAFKEFGIDGLENKSRRPKTNPRETPIRIKERIIELRKEKNECALKIQWDLEDEGIGIHFQTIQKIIKIEGLTRKYRTRKIHYNYVRIPLKKGELVEIDVKFVPDRIEGQRYYQFTAIDCSSRWRYMQAYENADNVSSIAFLEELMSVADFKIQAVKTDNGSCFTNRYTGYNKSSDPLNLRLHAFDILCSKLGTPHCLIDPGKPQQNSFVERSHRTDQQKFYDQLIFQSFEDLKYKLRLWNMYYNDTKHCGLNGKTPNQALRLF